MTTPRDLSRRQFLARSAGLAGASIGLGVHARDPSLAESGKQPVRIGFVGLGDRGMQLLSLTLQLPGATVVALADVNPGHLKRAADLARDHQPKASTDGKAIFDRKDLDAVVIASPVHLHPDHALRAIDAGKHVFLEKPLCLTPLDCMRVRNAAVDAERRGRIFQIGLQRRYSPRYRRSVEAIRTGDAGRVLFIRAQWHSTGNPARGTKPWYFRREKSGDVVVEQACHQMDVFNWVLGGEPLQACGFGGLHHHIDEPPGRDVRDHYGLVLEYAGGAKVHYSHLSYSVPDRRFSGTYELVFGEKLGVDLGNAVAWDRAGRTVELTRDGGNDTLLAMEDFLRCARSGERPAADIRVACSSTLTSLLALRALDTGRTVTWKEMMESAGPA